MAYQFQHNYAQARVLQYGLPLVVSRQSQYRSESLNATELSTD